MTSPSLRDAAVLAPRPDLGCVAVSQLVDGRPAIVFRTRQVGEAWALRAALAATVDFYRPRLPALVDLDALPPGDLAHWRETLLAVVALGAELVGHFAQLVAEAQEACTP